MNHEYINNLKVSELKLLCEKLHLKKTGLKQDLINRVKTKITLINDSLLSEQINHQNSDESYNEKNQSLEEEIMKLQEQEYNESFKELRKIQDQEYNESLLNDQRKIIQEKVQNNTIHDLNDKLLKLAIADKNITLKSTHRNALIEQVTLLYTETIQDNVENLKESSLSPQSLRKARLNYFTQHS